MSRRDFLRMAGATLLASAAPPLRADAVPAALSGLNDTVVVSLLQALASSQLRRMSHTPIVLNAVTAQNKITRAYGRGLMARLNGDWRREVNHPERRTLIASVMDTPASHFLKRVEELSEGLYTEVMLFDGRGLTVALSRLAALYWHGERARWQVPYEEGLEGFWVGPYERNTSTGVWQRQVSITVSDPSSLYPLGVLCAGVAVEKL